MQEERKEKRYFTVKEIADKLKIVPSTVHRWIYSGKLKAWRIGGVIRIDEDELKRIGIEM